MKTCVYLIYHCENFILVGEGGTVGRTHTQRDGYFLPGGTVSFSGEPTWREICNKASDEVKEEFGVFRRDLLQKSESFDSFGSHMREMDGTRVYFIYFGITKAAMLEVWGYVEDGKKDKKDSGFEKCYSAPIVNARIHFESDKNKSWFVEGLDMLNKISMTSTTSKLAGS